MGNSGRNLAHEEDAFTWIFAHKKSRWVIGRSCCINVGMVFRFLIDYHRDKHDGRYKKDSTAKNTAFFKS